MTKKNVIAQLESLKCHCELMQDQELKITPGIHSVWGKDVKALTKAIKYIKQIQGYENTIKKFIRMMTDMGWKNPEKELPEDCEHVLVQMNTGYMHEAYFVSGRCHIVGCYTVDIEEIRGWRPLPEECKEERNDRGE